MTAHLPRLPFAGPANGRSEAPSTTEAVPDCSGRGRARRRRGRSGCRAPLAPGADLAPRGFGWRVGSEGRDGIGRLPAVWSVFSLSSQVAALWLSVRHIADDERDLFDCGCGGAALFARRGHAKAA